MPLKIMKVKDELDPKKKRTVVVLVPDKEPYIIGSKVPPPVRMAAEVDYDMQRIQGALIPALQRSTSKGA